MINNVINEFESTYGTLTLEEKTKFIELLKTHYTNSTLSKATMDELEKLFDDNIGWDIEAIDYM
jgi:hypothetical protein